MRKISTFILLLYTLLRIFPGAAWALTIPSGMTVVKNLLPGSSTSGKIIILNNDDKSVIVRIYKTDYLFDSEGKSDFAKPGSVSRSNASWIKYSANQITIPPSGRTSVYYEINAPHATNLCGTYWSTCMIEALSPNSLTPPHPEKDKVKVGVQAVFRYAVQMVTNIGDGGTRKLKFANKKLVVKEGKTSLVLDVKNTGERWLRPSVYVDLYDSQGQRIGRYNGGKLRIFPGCSVRYSVDLGRLSPQTYDALVIADTNDDKNVFGAKYILEIK